MLLSGRSVHPLLRQYGQKVPNLSSYDQDRSMRLWLSSVHAYSFLPTDVYSHALAIPIAH